VHELSKSVLDGSAVLHRTSRRSKAAYINQRVNQVSGKTVRTALLEMVANTRGHSAHYTRADIRYDVERGLLELREGGEGGAGAGGSRG
jgi:hypothetical protein